MKTKLAMGAALIGAAIFGAVAVGYSAAQSDKSRFSEDDKDAIRDIVEDYINENPDVIIDALNAYAQNEQAREAEQVQLSAEENLPAMLASNAGYTAGADIDNASVAVIEFFDYHCSFCKKSAGLVQDLTRGDKAVKVVFRELPIIRRESEYPAKAALAARAQGKYTEFHFKLMNAKGTLTPERVDDIAKDVGLDLARLKADIDSKEVADSLDETFGLARDLGINGTPSFVIASLDGGYVTVISGNRQEEITEAIAAAKKQQLAKK